MITRSLAFALAGGVALIDHGTKAAARATLTTGPVELLPVLDLRLGFNTGVSFGLFAGGTETTRWILIAATSVVAVWLSLWMARERRAASGRCLRAGAHRGRRPRQHRRSREARGGDGLH